MTAQAWFGVCVWSCNQTGAHWVFTCLLWSISWWGCWLLTGTWSLWSFSTETCTQHTLCEYLSASFIFIYQLNLIHYTCKGKTGRGGEDDMQHRAAGRNQTLQLDLDPLVYGTHSGQTTKAPTATDGIFSCILSNASLIFGNQSILIKWHCCCFICFNLHCCILYSWWSDLQV